MPASRGRSLLRSPVGRTFLLWCLLIVMFLTLWTVLSKPGQAPVPLESPGGFWASQLGATTFALGTCAVIFAFIFVAAKRFNSANAAGLQSLAEGEFARAEGEFAVLSRRFRWLGAFGAIASFNLALARLYQGKLEDAIERFGAIEKRASVSALNVKPNAACYLAIAYALRGQLDFARTWLAEAEKQANRSPHKSTLTGLIAFGRAIIELREGRDREVLEWLDPRWRGLEGSLTGGSMRFFTVLRAFATARAGGEREVGAAERILHGLDPIRPGEFAMLEAEWPEMQRFLHR